MVDGGPPGGPVDPVRDGPWQSRSSQGISRRPRHIKRALRELADRAYEIELGRELGALQEEFARWQRGEVTAFDLSEAIHQFHQRPARELYMRYADPHPNMVVAFAIKTGILDRTQVPSDVLEYLVGALSFYAAQRSTQ